MKSKIESREVADRGSTIVFKPFRESPKFTGIIKHLIKKEGKRWLYLVKVTRIGGKFASVERLIWVDPISVEEVK